ncbi:E3 ubiquitin-protein ligase TOM1-like protein [Tolypocladium ophioglossoides CBS 100239]|uniref:HECT-type E3 ubiquitin transferase n=1 Tax=Tolypocladium ophioglossoides (strain CBS 100239) TaxID=1163406 RepID=A0A0L0NJP9_TOLOC|nr:E3 ubiquitin-protein ligase TOM1-like protein [Tolypocladium ophioglossoides CBS 100239]
MGKITKTIQPKHRETLSPWLRSYVQAASTTPLPSLPKHLATFPSRWPFGRGDLYHWIPLLNRFDSILEQFCKTYELHQGPQSREFGVDLLLNQTKDSAFGGEKEWNEKELADLGFSSDGDRVLVEVVLKFTRMLLEHCGNRSIYASSAHLNDLLNTTSLPIIIATLEVGSELAQRYQASVKRIGSASRQISAALLANHYNIDLDRVQQMALPFVKTPIASLSDATPATTPVSAKGKDKAHGGSGKNATSMHANDLVAIAGSDDRRWKDWTDVRVFYYPQDSPSSPDAPVDHGPSSVPSTPTPLRRSSTMTTQHITPRPRNAAGEDSSPIVPRTPAIADEPVTPGQKSFDIPRSAVAATPIYDLVHRCPDDMPPAAKYEVFHRLRVSKAFTESPESRQQILATRLLAITNLAYIHTEFSFVEKVLRQDIDETRRYQLVYQLAELIHPSADGKIDVPLWLQSIALALMEAVSGFHARCQDVLSALNANVNHGILLYVIRKAVAGMAKDDIADANEQVTEADEWRNNLFSLTLHLSMATRVGNEMVSAGLMDILVDILKIRTKIAQRHHAMVLAFLDGLIWTYQNAFTAFFNASGLDAVAKLVVDAVGEAQASLKSSQGIKADQQSSAVDYEIPFYQQQTLKWLLKFVHHVMSNSYTYSGNTDRLLRNLAEKSDLLRSLREIMEDKKIFGSVVWTNSVTILSDFINNDPTSFAAISESGMIRTYLAAITGRPVTDPIEDEPKPKEQDDDNNDESPDNSAIASIVEQDERPHPPPDETLRQDQRGPLATGILASSDAINVVPQVLNSISLNNTGMKMVVSSRAFDSYFEIFESPAHVKCMATDGELAHYVGGSFDELARHHPPLRTSISNAAIDMVARVRFLGLEKARTSGWGAKLFTTDSKGLLLSVTESGSLEDASKLSSQVKEHAILGDADVDMSDAVSPIEASPGNREDAPRETSTESIAPYIHAMASFLTAYLSNSLLKSQFVKKGGIELLLDICESPSLPATFGDSAASRVLTQVLSQLVEQNAIRVLPSLLRRAQASLDILKPLAAKTEARPPHFAPFLGPDLDTGSSETILTGTKLVKALLNAQTFIKILSDCFYTSRNNNLSFYPINVYDYYLALVKSIGPLLRGVLAEEAGELSVVPQHWSLRRHAPPGDSITRNADAETDDTSLPDVMNNTGSWKSAGNADASAPTRPTEQEQSSPRFQNNETLRVLLHPMIPTSFPLFQSMGRALLPRRSEPNLLDAFTRSRHLEIAKALADSVLGHLGPAVATPEPTSKDFHYWIIMLHTIHEMLIDHPSARQTDRASVHIIMPVLLAFKEQGGFGVLNSMLKVFARAVRQGTDVSSDESSKAKVAAFALKKVLDLYYVLLNGKHLSDTGNFFNLQNRLADRAHPALVYQQIVVELRAAVLPAIMELWDSNFVERVPDSTVKRLLDILKIISTADHELQAVQKNSAIFDLFKYTDARFDWRPRSRHVHEMLSHGYDEGLVHEAMYRANGNHGFAMEYCRAHTDGLAGTRSPIAPEDTDTSALTAPPRTPNNDQESSANEIEPSTGPSLSDADRMSLDALPDLTAEGLRDLIERSDHMDEAQDSHSAPTAPTPATPGADSADRDAEAKLVAAKEGLDTLRAKLRDNLIDQCLDVIRAHPDTAIEVSDLITAIVLRRQNHEAQEEVGSTLTFALSSLALDDEEKKRNGRCIAAYAHLLALLLQDEKFFERNVETLREKVEEYVNFLKVPLSTSTDDVPPWIPFVLLILEVMLCHDERPVPAQWKAPKSLEEPVATPIIQMGTALVDSEQRTQILESLLDLLPRIGKEEMLATAVLRVLVILTRRRHAAKLVGEKKNLQRLFLMAKQLSGSGSERLKQTRMTAYVITVLRHIIEDEEIIKQVMRAEIQADFPNIHRNQRGSPDVTTYLRAMAPVALRAPDLFVDVTNELLEFTRWQPSSADGTRSQPLAMKESPKETTDDAKPAETSGQDIKPSTETADKEMADAPKAHHDSKRPVVENPDGVIHFLLCELVNYREVDDKEPPVVGKESKPESELSTEAHDAPTKDNAVSDGKDKKAKPIFKAVEHPIFVYRCFLVSCLAELLQSYTRTKVEFINFKRSAPPLSTHTPIKPRSSILNYLIYDLLCQGNLNGTTDSIASKKKAATSSLTQRVLVALVARTNEKPVERGRDKFAYDDEPDLLFVRKLVLDTILKAYEKAPFTDEPLETRYSRMQCLAELMNHMIGEKDKEQSSGTRSSDNGQSRSQAQLRRLMYEKGYVDKLTSSIAEISLNYPGVKRAIKYILRVLRVLTGTAKELSLSPLSSGLSSDPAAGDNSVEEFASSSSLSDLDDDREETPDLYRNSALGMLEPRGEDDESEDDDEDDDEDMYGDEYDDEEMDYGDDDISNDGEDNISDEDEELSGMGEIEGLHGEPGVVEVIMDEDEDDDDTSDDEDDDEMESADMEDVEDRVEIVDEDGNPIEEDGDSGWESESDVEDDEDPEADDLNYEEEVQDEDEAHIHGLGAGDLLDNMARAIMGDDDGYEPELGLEDHYLDDGHDEGEDDDDEEDIEDEEYIYDDVYPLDDQPPAMPALGWDGLNPEVDDRNRQLFFVDGSNRRPVLARMDNRSPFPPRFMAGPNRDHLGEYNPKPSFPAICLSLAADFRSYFSRNHRSAGTQSNAEDGLNPLLRRNDHAPDASPRPGHSHSVGLRLPEGVFGTGRHAIDGPMGLLGELMEFLPIMGRNNGGQAFHFHITGPGGTRETREIGTTRWSRSDQRREGSAQEPHQAVSFTPESTLDRYQEEARMIFGANHTAEASKLNNVIVANLTPAAIEREKKIKTEEAEMHKKLDEERKKREEEEHKAQEAKAAEEKAAREKKEAEEREAAEQAAAEAAANSTATDQPVNDEQDSASSAMEGVESTEPVSSGDGNIQNSTAAAAGQPRVMTTLRGEEVDVTELGIDPDYLAALPEEFREEVIAQTVSERRSQAREEAATGESTEVFQEFLDALPEELRLEIAQQERQDERRRQREESRRQAAHAGGQSAIAAEMDPASILLTFPPELREQALIDQGEDLMDQLPPEMAAQARALAQQHAPVPQHHGIRSIVAPGRTAPGAGRGAGSDAADGQGENKIQRRTVVQMLDKSGIATLLRLMFIAQQGSIRNYLFSVFADVCENRQNRLEVISSIMQILQDGSADMNALERSFGQLSLKARKHKEKDAEQKTPQSVKKTLTNVCATSTTQTNSETSPLLIVQQCLDLLVDLCTKSHHIPWLFLTEHEIVGATLKRALNRKGKAKDSKAHKYAINSLLTLLDRELVTESSLVMTHLADLLNRVTLPLQNLERRRKETVEETKSGEADAGAANAAEQAVSSEANDTTSGLGQGSDQNAPEADVTAATKEEEQKDVTQTRPRQLQPPVIPAENLTLVVRIFVARECNSKTFQNTISTIKNLSAIPGAKEAFGHELVRQARLLSENIVSDLDDLLPHIAQATTGTEIQGVALAKFSPGASEQNKLLRVLTALDHLFDGKKKARDEEDERSREKEKQYLVTSLYHNSTFSAMWEKLSACLSAIRQRENMLNVATILLPLIESLMVVCKNTTTNDDQSQSQVTKDMVLSSPPPESRTANLFFSFTEDHRRILNELVRHNPKLMSGTFALLVKNPKVLEFDNKRNYFNRSVHSRTGQNNGRPSYPALQLSVRRDHVFHDSFKSLYFKSGDEMKFGKLNIRFHGEEGVDAGGVTREWFQVLARQMFDPNYALFIPVSSDRTTFHPNKLSGINDEHLMFFKFIGRIIGKALYEGRLLDCFFSRAVYKRILGKSVSVKDIESFDPDYYKSLCWMLENDITDIITETFSVEDDEFGVTNVVDLIPNGREISVTEENKHEYVRLVVEHKLLSSVKDQMENFLKGFHETIPAKLISIFNEQELELLISGLPAIDIDDWKSNTEYQNYTPSSQQIQWFWRAVRSFDKEERAKLLQFVTGTSKVPLNGFKELEGMNGVNRFNIHRDYGNKDRLPSSHTCFNQLDLPEYESYDALRSQILKAITQGSEYFGFA